MNKTLKKKEKKPSETKPTDSPDPFGLLMKYGRNTPEKGSEQVTAGTRDDTQQKSSKKGKTS